MINPDITRIWVYLAASPLLWLTITLITYCGAHRLFILAKSNSLLHPVATSVLVLIAFLLITNTSYKTYFSGAQFVHFLLGPATVALAVPLFNQIEKLKTVWLPLTIALISGVCIGTLSAVGIGSLFGAGRETLLSIAPKSVTTPVAMGISENIGGIPSLTAVMVVVTGIIGAIIGTKIFDIMRINDDSIKGVAMGVNAHGIGTARAFQVSHEMGAFSGLAMALSALATAFIVPWLVKLLGI